MEAPGRLYGCHQAVVLGLVAEACVVLASRTEAPMLVRLLQPWLGLHLQVTPSLYLGPTSLYVGQLEQILGRADDAVAHLATWPPPPSCWSGPAARPSASGSCASPASARRPRRCCPRRAEHHSCRGVSGVSTMGRP